MLDWVTEHNCTFYVKDLVSYLKDNYDYRGCEGTARRSLVKAGYRRKMVSHVISAEKHGVCPTAISFRADLYIKKPWHKSEITIWVPPASSVAAEKRVLRTDQVGREQSDSTSQNPSALAELQDDIDPALREAANEEAVVIGNPVPDLPSRQTRGSPRSSIVRLDSPTKLGSVDNAAAASDAGVGPRNSTVSSHSPHTYSNLRKKHLCVEERDNEALKQQVSSLQHQLSHQQELITQLHCQLAESRRSNSSYQVESSQPAPKNPGSTGFSIASLIQPDSRYDPGLR